MSVCNVSEIWQQDLNLDSKSQLYSSLLDSLCPFKPPDFSREIQLHCQEESQKVQKPETLPQQHLDMLSDQPKSNGMSECLNSNFTLNDCDSEQESYMLIGDPSETQNNIRSKNSSAKNILGYQTRKVIKLMLKYHQPYLSKKCRASGINYRDFKRFYISAEKKLYGPISLDKLFYLDPENPKETKIKKIFEVVFHKILRKEYLIYSLKLGKMQDHSLYIQEKNRKLLYYISHDQML